MFQCPIQLRRRGLSELDWDMHDGDGIVEGAVGARGGGDA